MGPDRSIRRGGYRRMSDGLVSRTDPDATHTGRARITSRLGYNAHYVVDGGKARVILSALVVPADVKDNLPMLDLLWRTCFRWRLRPHHVTGDSIYGSLENIRAMEDAGILTFVPVRDWTHNDWGATASRLRVSTYGPPRPAAFCALVGVTHSYFPADWRQSAGCSELAGPRVTDPITPDH